MNTRRNIFKPELLRLESRSVPAVFNFLYSGTSLIVDQIGPADGTIDFVDDGTTLTIDDSSTVVSVNVAGIQNITYNLFPADTDSIDYEQIGFRPGNVTWNVNNFAFRDFDFDDGTGGIGGDFRITTGNGGLDLEVADEQPVTIGGNFFAQFGSVDERIEFGDEADLVTIGGNITLINVNDIELETTNIGGSVFASFQGDSSPTDIDTDSDSFIGGNFTYFGVSGSDELDFDGFIGGNLLVNFQTQAPTGTDDLNITSTSTVAGNLTVMGGNLGTDIVTVAAGATINGNITLMMGGGTNDVDLLGLLTGGSITYLGGSGADSLTLTPTSGSSSPRIFALMAAGDDVVEIDSTMATPSFLFIDFGAGSDTFTSMGGAIFPSIIRNL
ncbi:MAG: hypothetical protein ACFCD0_29325 [Gemmataceae bacterium]